MTLLPKPSLPPPAAPWSQLMRNRLIYSVSHNPVTARGEQSGIIELAVFEILL